MHLIASLRDNVHIVSLDTGGARTSEKTLTPESRYALSDVGHAKAASPTPAV
jgi:hypothetical protein